jgi:flavin-dependent dehydrogenase
MHRVDLISPQYEQIFIGDFTATGYAYVFPIGKRKANIGVGCSKPTKPMEDYFNEFLQLPEMKHQVKKAARVEDKGGKANVLRISNKLVYGNVILTGDAGDQNLKPFVEGIVPAIICGDLAGKTTANHIKQGLPLKDYPLDVMKRLGDFFKDSDTAGNMIYDLFEMKQPKAYLLMLALLADIETADKIKELKKKDYNTLRDEILDWNNWHKQTIANTKETFYYELERAKQTVIQIWN